VCATYFAIVAAGLVSLLYSHKGAAPDHTSRQHHGKVIKNAPKATPRKMDILIQFRLHF
jgi:hypothetical protein